MFFKPVCLSFCPQGRCLPDTPPAPRQTPPWADTPAGRHPPWADTPAGRHPPCPVHAGIHTPLPSACWDIHSPCTVHAGIRSSKRAVRILLECILVVDIAVTFHSLPNSCKKTDNNFSLKITIPASHNY